MKIFAVNRWTNKRRFAWGFKSVLTFGGKDLTEHHYEVLNKSMGTTRSSVCSSSPDQLCLAMKNLK